MLVTDYSQIIDGKTKTKSGQEKKNWHDLLYGTYHFFRSPIPYLQETPRQVWKKKTGAARFTGREAAEQSKKKLFKRSNETTSVNLKEHEERKKYAELHAIWRG